ncbi:DUF805 domain-containing protein [Sulfitobacter sp. D35]|uniref:DUF805 domain-containing protein n=1 Tax=Sulfitobacter sp. D35 TaxID=3083252 RepID=UPI00296FCE8D|nr:DUF805 domain-containing protein [Sulfitobacter sp. D35]MDW4499056.1 DUF805 domain-containing protein [Sulfitobacter sp. D35]
MGFIDAIKTCFAKYVTFSGRAPRSEYWWFFLFVILGGIVASLIDLALFGAPEPVEGEPSSSGGPINGIFSLVTFLPLLAAGWRRMHDTGRSGKLLLLPLAVTLGLMLLMLFGIMGVGMIEQAGGAEMVEGPAIALGTFGMILILVLQIVLSILILWWLSRPSQPGTNEYGPNPQEVTQ